ncbi:hypothetical protein OQA88_7776 [Cercophora sp. LCS_1]
MFSSHQATSNMVVPRNLGQEIAEANRALLSLPQQLPQRNTKKTKRAPRIANGRSTGAQIAEGTRYLSQLAQQQQQQADTMSVSSASTFSSRISLIKARFSRRNESQQQLLGQENILRTQIRMGV